MNVIPLGPLWRPTIDQEHYARAKKLFKPEPPDAIELFAVLRAIRRDMVRDREISGETRQRMEELYLRGAMTGMVT